MSSVHSCCLRAGFLAENRAAGGEWRGVGWGRDLFIIDHSGMSRKDGHPVDTRWTDWTSRLVGGPAVVCSDFYNGLCAHGLLSNSRKFVLTVFSSSLCNGLFGPVWTIKKNHYCYFIFFTSNALVCKSEGQEFDSWSRRGSMKGRLYFCIFIFFYSSSRVNTPADWSLPVLPLCDSSH